MFEGKVHSVQASCCLVLELDPLAKATSMSLCNFKVFPAFTWKFF